MSALATIRPRSQIATNVHPPTGCHAERSEASAVAFRAQTAKLPSWRRYGQNPQIGDVSPAWDRIYAVQMSIPERFSAFTSIRFGGVLAVALASMLSILAHAQSADTSTSRQPISAGVAAIPQWLPIPIPPALYEKWRKYGQWDYKQQGSQYRDFTLFNFGATGGAAGLDEKSLAALAQSSEPTRDDIRGLNYTELQANFLRDAGGLEGLRTMAVQDAHLIRVATDFTWLDTDTKWPRENVGISEVRWDEYRSAFKKLSLSEGIVRTEDFPGAIFFITRVKGLCTGGSSAGYVFSTTPLTPTARSPQDDLDAARKNPSKHYAYVFKLLKPNWYAFYEIDW